jgi:NAD(P)-dependent dehydrogenase (short-subunit alcohol dehydrogenase family)
LKKTINPEEINFKDKFDLSGKVIIVTGGCGLIGRAFCEAIAQFGGSIIIADILASDPIGNAASLKKRFSQKIEGFILDVENRISVNQLLDFAVSNFTKIDGLVNAHQNKSHLKFEAFENVSDENWDKVINVNLKGTFLTCQIIGSYMASNNGGSIVNMPSTYSVVAPNQRLYDGTMMGCPAEYSASKGGIDALSRYLASYWASKNVRVNMITPHGVWNNHEKQFEENFSRFSPMQRMSFNHEVAPALIYLLSDASSYVTGSNLLNEGGWTVW